MYKFLFSVIVLMPVAACAQSNKTAGADRERLIAASQSGASPLFFDPAAADVPLIRPAAFDDERECTVRDGVPDILHRAKAGNPVTMGYIGGSIVQSVHGYRAASARYIQSLLPSVPMKAINAFV